MTPISAPHIGATRPNQLPGDAALHEAAVSLEASFLAEMLKAAGLGETRGSYGGGAGEDQFSSFLVREQAMQMARAGGIGLAETIYRAMRARDDV